MKSVIDLFEGHPRHTRHKGDFILREGKNTFAVFVLIKGSVEIIKNGVRINVVSEPGAILGEMSVLLDSPNTASVRTLEDAEFYIAEQDYVQNHPEIIHHVAQQLARRLFSINSWVSQLREAYNANRIRLEQQGLVEKMQDVEGLTVAPNLPERVED